MGENIGARTGKTASEQAHTPATLTGSVQAKAAVGNVKAAQKAPRKVAPGKSDESEVDDSDDEAEPLQLDIDNFGRPHGVKGSLDYSFRSIHCALNIPDDKSYAALVDDCETAFTAREIENAEYSTGTTFFLPATMEPRSLLERMAREVFDFHTRDVMEFNPDKSGAEWWTLVLDAGSDTSDDVAFHWDRDYGLEDQYHVNLHPHVGTVTYLSDVGGPTVVLERVSPVQTGSDDCGAGVISKGYLSRPMLGKHISFDGRLLHGAPGDLATVFSEFNPGYDRKAAGEKRKRVGGPSHDGQRVTFLVNVWLNHKPIDSDPFPEANLVQLRSSKLSGAAFGFDAAVSAMTSDELVRSVTIDEHVNTLKLSFVEAGRRMALTLPIPVAKLQEETRKSPQLSSFEVVFPASGKIKAELIAGEEVDDDDEEEGQENSDENEDDDGKNDEEEEEEGNDNDEGYGDDV